MMGFDWVLVGARFGGDAVVVGLVGVVPSPPRALTPGSSPGQALALSRPMGEGIVGCGGVTAVGEVGGIVAVMGVWLFGW